MNNLDYLLVMYAYKASLIGMNLEDFRNMYSNLDPEVRLILDDFLHKIQSIRIHDETHKFILAFQQWQAETRSIDTKFSIEG